MDFSFLFTKEYIALISVIIGAILGFTLSLAKDWIIEGRKQKEKDKQFRREKLEEVFSLLDKVNKNAMKPIAQYDENVDSTKLTMIIRFYFSEPDSNLNDVYQKYLEEYVEINRIKISGENHVDAYMNSLAKSYRTLCNQIVEESKRV